MAKRLPSKWVALRRVSRETEGRLPKGEDNMTSTVLFLPWVQIENPIVVGDVIFYPFAEALTLAGERRAQLKLFGSIYVDGYTLALASERREPAPRLRPTVVFVAEDDERARHARDAVDVLMLSTILENGVLHANGATFASVIRWLDGEPGFMVDFTPRMHGSTTNGIGANTYFEMKPPRTGSFHHSRRAEMVDALWAAVNGTFATELRKIFDTLRTATSESPDVSMDLAESLMAKAATLLTHLPGTPDQKGPMLARLRSLLTRFTVESTGDEYGFHIARVWQAVRDHRNDFWHPERRSGALFPFNDQTRVTPLVLALRMVHALVAARLIELGFASDDSELAADVVAIERWISTLGPDLEADLEPVTDAASMMKSKERTEKVERSFWESRSHARFERAVANFVPEDATA